MLARIIIIYIFNVFDLIMTIYLTNKFGVNIEGNPLGRFLLEKPLLLMFVKIEVIGVLLGIIYYARNYKIAQVASWILLAIFTILTIYHIIIIGKAHYILFIEK